MSLALEVWAPAKPKKATIVTTNAVATVIPSESIVPDGEPVAAGVVFDEDRDLLDRLAANDDAAFRKLVERHIDRAYAIALRITGNAADAEDVVQDTMLKVWSCRQSWRPGPTKFAAWLYRVIFNRCIDLRRKQRPESMDGLPEPADGRPDAVSVIERNELTNILNVAMQRLPEQQMVAVILSYHENMSNGEIAQVMDTTTAAVESLLKRGRQQLRQLLRQHEHDILAAITDC